MFIFTVLLYKYYILQWFYMVDIWQTIYNALKSKKFQSMWIVVFAVVVINAINRMNNYYNIVWFTFIFQQILTCYSTFILNKQLNNDNWVQKHNVWLFNLLRRNNILTRKKRKLRRFWFESNQDLTFNVSLKTRW